MEGQADAAAGCRAAGNGGGNGAGRRRWRVLGWIARGAGAVAGMVAVCVLALFWRLQHAPIEVTRLLRAVLVHADLPAALHPAVAHATLFWDRRNGQSPLDLDMTGVVLRRRDGSVAAQAGRLQAAVRLDRLLTGRIRLVAIDLHGGSVALVRDSHGVALDDGRPPARGNGAAGWLKLLRRVELGDLSVTVTDRLLGAVWHATLRDLRASGLERGGHRVGQATAKVLLRGQSSDMSATLTPEAAGAQLSLDWTAVTPAALGLATAALHGVALPVEGHLRVRLTADLVPQGATLALRLGAGQLDVAQGKLPVAAGTMRLEAGPAGGAPSGMVTVRLVAAHIRLLAPDGTRPLLTAEGRGTGAGPAWTGAVTVGLDRIGLAGLAGIWPEGLAKGARRWVTGNIDAGMAHDAHVALDWRYGPPTGLTIAQAQGELAATGMRIAWLRPVPPAAEVEATLTLQSPDLLMIHLIRGVQQPSDPGAAPLALHDGSLRITGLTQPDQQGTLSMEFDGPVAQAVALLREQRLHLLAAHPIRLDAPSGRLEAHLGMSLPLVDGVTIDRIAIAARADIHALHLGGVIAGRDLDAGALSLHAGNDGLSIAGTAQLAGVPATVGVTMDFRPGPPAGTVARYTAAGHASIAQLQAAGLSVGGVADGTLDYRGAIAEHRDGTGQADVHVDLRSTALALNTIGWRKPLDDEANADAVVLLKNDVVVGVDRLTVTGPGVDVLGRATYAQGQPVALVFDHIVLGQTRAEGELRFSGTGNSVLRADLHGPVLDLGTRLKADGTRPVPGHAEAQAAARQRRQETLDAHTGRGRPWQADLRFDTVLLGPDHALHRVVAHAENDGLLVQRARLDAAAGDGAVHMTLQPRPGGGRSLTTQAADAGGLLAALDIASSIRGGHLSVDAAYDDSVADHPLSGTALIDDFRVVGAPSVARLLQAMTLYGLLDVLRGPGLGISHLIAPFRYANAVLSLESARAFSSSLGFTAKGEIDLAAQRADLVGTIVPGYFFNTLPGRIPVLGKLFSPEKGGGVLSATYKLSGPLANPSVQINPLAALAPGILRGLFGILDGSPSAKPAPEPLPPTHP